jgi:hypothetical protein
MRDWLRKRLDAYGESRERRDEEFAALVNSRIDALADRRILWLNIAILSFANLIVWLSVILFPADVLHAWQTVDNLDEKIAFTVLAITFGLGMWLTYSLFRLRFPDIENPRFDEEVFASFSYSLHSTKRWRIWLAAVVGGVLNALGLIFVEILLVYGY